MKTNLDIMAETLRDAATTGQQLLLIGLRDDGSIELTSANEVCLDVIQGGAMALLTIAIDMCHHGGWIERAVALEEAMQYLGTTQHVSGHIGRRT